MLEEILANLDSTEEGERLHTRVRQLVIKHRLDEELASDILDFEAFRDSLDGLAYEDVRASQEPGDEP